MSSKRNKYNKSNKDYTNDIQEKVYPIVFITDDNYAMPTAVSITSLYYNRNEYADYRYVVYVICSGVSDENIEYLKALSKNDFPVNIIIEDPEKYAHIGSNTIHVTSAAIYKFELPNIFAQYEKILYLDSDMIIAKDLGDLFEVDIENKYAAVVKDYKTTTYKPNQLTKLHVEHKHKFYWNSGMMLLNLKKMREDNLPEKLMDYKLHGINYFMDQDALNVVFEENVKYVPFYYNLMTTVITLYSPEIMMNFYDIEEYKSIQELLTRSSIVHLAGPFKPWEHLIPVLSDYFEFYYSKSPYSNIPLKLLDNDKITTDNAVTSDEEIPIVYICENKTSNAAFVSLQSLIHNKLPDTKYNITLLLFDVDNDKIRRFNAIKGDGVNINVKIIDEYDYTNSYDQMGSVIRPALIARFDIHKFFPQYDKIIFMSSFTLAMKDLTALYQFDVDGYYCAATEDYRITNFAKGRLRDMGLSGAYFNSGVMLYNLKEIRNSDVSSRMLHYKMYGVNYYAEQDVINVCMRDKIKKLPYYFNACDNIFDKESLLEVSKKIGVYRFYDQAEFFSRCYIIQFCAKERPWNEKIPLLSDIFLRYYIRSVMSDIPYSSTDIQNEVQLLLEDKNHIVCSHVDTTDDAYKKKISQALYCNSDFTPFVLESDIENQVELFDSIYADVSEDGFNTTEERNPRIIVSLTTIPQRIEAAAKVISIMLHQTVKPDKIILYLATDEFADIELPELLLKEQECGVEIVYCDNLYCHKKYYYTLRDYPDDIIITVDDDLMYEETLIEQLYNSYLKHPNAVSAMRAHRITFCNKNQIAPYSKWVMKCSDFINIPSLQLLPTGVGGVLYPPHSLPAETLNLEAIMELCPMADDLWLKIMELVNNTPVVIPQRQKALVFINGTQECGLYLDNVKNNQNDVQLKQILDRYADFNEGENLVTKMIEADTIPALFTDKPQQSGSPLQVKIQDLTKDVTDAKNRINTLKKNLEEAEKTSEKNAKKMKDFESKSVELENKFTESEKSRKYYHKKMKDYIAENEELSKKLAELEQKFAESEKSCKFYKTKMTEYKKDSDSLIEVRKSATYKIGRFITFVPRKIIALFKRKK